MSRLPPNLAPGYPSSHQHPIYYTGSGQNLPSQQPQSMHQHPLPIQSQASYDPSVYPFPRVQAQNGWPTEGGQGHANGYPAGPSRGGNPYQSYAPPQRSSSDQGQTAPRQPPGPPLGAGWSSVHPSATSSLAPPRTDVRGGAAVKLEDLVSQDRARQAIDGAPPSGPGGLTSMPLNVSVMAADPGKRPGTAQSGGEGIGVSGQQSGPSEFIKKLYKMLEEESVLYRKGRAGQVKSEVKRGSVGWGRGGTSFVVWDMNDFTTKVLPQTFRHSNFSSFVRQLNKYGFSKIKHVDEETGQIKENVWEFQHPNFQAGGRADLDSIKRKAVAPKKGPAEPENETSPSGSRTAGLSGEDALRLMEMENRVLGLEDRLAKALDEVREARSREVGMVALFRDVIGHLAAVEKENASSGVGDEPSPRIMHLYQLYDQLAQPGVQEPFSRLPDMMPLQPVFPLRMTPGMPGPAHAHISPRTDGSGSRGSGGRPSPSTASRNRPDGVCSSTHLSNTAEAEDIIEIPEAQQQTLYNGEPMGVTPVFVETPAWLTENTTAPIPIYHRKSSDGLTLRLMVEALAGQGEPRFDGTQDPLDMSPRHDQRLHDNHAGSSSTSPGLAGSRAVGVGSSSSTAENMPSIQQAPFGTLIIPAPSSASSSGDNTGGNPVRIRRSSTIRPHWNKAPRILVVEDDVVYRQLSSKFLEKFGCVTETVENAQGAVEKMNRTKYDLVLMDIFFGPNMDGRKATSLIRQFDMYTPIISMTSNAQPKDVDSYLQSGMNDVLAKPFTKHGLFGILDKHLIHLKAIQLSAEVPRSLGVPPLSDQGVVEAVAVGAVQWAGVGPGLGIGLGIGGGAGSREGEMRNPLAGMGWSDETYQIVLSQFLATGMMPDISSINLTHGVNGNGSGSSNGLHDLPPAQYAQIQHPDELQQGHQQHQQQDQGQHQQQGQNQAIGTNILFDNKSGYSAAGVGLGKRSIELVEEWSPVSDATGGAGPGLGAGKEGRDIKKAKGR